MIVVKLKGGLGNQMFQYATALRLAVTRNTELYMDLSEYGNMPDYDTPRTYELDDFKLHKHEINIADYVLISRGYGFKGRSKRYLMNLHKKKLWSYINADQGFFPEVLHLPNSTYLHGQFHSEKYFIDIRDRVLKDFSYKSKPSTKSSVLLDSIKETCSVSLHVRRGDYVTNPTVSQWLGVLPLSYYKESIQILRKKFKNPIFYVFSDDLEWCKTHLGSGSSMVYVTHNTKGIEDLRLMIACKHNIVANSSFSWWGAWLGTDYDKIVIGPKNWFASSTLDSSDILPESWLAI